MPTVNQRAIAIVDAIINTTSTAGQRSRVVAAFDTAETLLAEVRALITDRVKAYESQASVIAAKTTSDAAVASGFTEAP